jgi:hypothetical protein
LQGREVQAAGVMQLCQRPHLAVRASRSCGWVEVDGGLGERGWESSSWLMLVLEALGSVKEETVRQSVSRGEGWLYSRLNGMPMLTTEPALSCEPLLRKI